MSAQPEDVPPTPHLRVVTIDEAGQATEGCANCVSKDDEIARLREEVAYLEDVATGHERDIRGWATRYAELKRDKEQEAKADPLWPDAVRLFKLYKRLAERPRLNWTVERFEMVQPFLKKHGIAMCERAIVGRVFEHYTAKRRNGTTVHYCEWERVFGPMGQGSAASNFEESCNRAPLDFVSELEVEDETNAAVAADRAKAEALRREDAKRGQGTMADAV